MKRLTCEMCGSTDLIKQEDVFVCQSCGCKYSVEAAKKMMIEGTVEVVGTVKIDETAKIDNYLTLSNSAYDSGNGESAFEYANKALEIAPNNPKAWIAKMKSLEFISTVGEPRLLEVVEAAKNAIAFADAASKKDIEFEVYAYYAYRSLDLLKVVTNGMLDTDGIRRIYKQFCLLTPFSAINDTLNADSEYVNTYDALANEALAIIDKIPDEIVADYPEIAKGVGECAKQYKSVTNALIRRFEVYNAHLLDSSAYIRDKNQKAIESKAKAGEKVAKARNDKEQADRKEKYWKEHAAEKTALENEKKALTDQIAALNKKFKELPDKAKIDEIRNNIDNLRSEKDSLGMFKGKEKKALQEKIDALYAEESNIQRRLRDDENQIFQKISPLKKRISEIDAEFTKQR